jgi:N-acetylglutamate synthase/N-acetylornithine aminotransferase
LKGYDVARPTSDRVKESLFNIIAGYLADAYVLDLYSGTGNLGIEALSRGARLAVFVDKSEKSTEVIKENLINTKLIDRGLIIKGEVYDVCTELSKMIARDGEGATKFIEIIAEGAATEEDAYKIVSAVAKSPLVKTSLFGEDANWGRILTAAGYSGAAFNPENIDIFIGDLLVCKNGAAVNFDEKEARSILKEKEIEITLKLGEGKFSDKMWTCDLSYDYVKINGSYRT